jgi:hypothetical protein
VISEPELFFLFDSKIRNEIESEDVRVFGAKLEGPFRFQQEEIDEVRFWTKEELADERNYELFTPNLTEEIRRLTDGRGVHAVVDLTAQPSVVAAALGAGLFATAQALVPQGILITVTIVASCVLIVVVRRLGLERRTAQLEALHAMGWQRTHLRKTAIAEVLSSAAPGLLAGAVFAVIGSVLLSPTAVLPAAGAGALTTIVVTAVVVRSSLRRR